MENFRGINIALDIFSAVITVLIGAYLVGRRNKSRDNQYFFCFCVLNFIFILGDLSDWCCNGLARPWYPVVLHAGQLVYYSIIAPLMLVFMRYITEYLSSFVRVSAVYMRITAVLAAVHLAGVLITPFTGFYYTITPENVYIRGDFVILASLLPVSVYILITVMALRFRKVLKARVVVTLLGFVAIPLIGHAIQFCIRGVALLNPAITLAALFVFFNIQLDRDIQHERNKQELAQANIKLMLSQIQPHFLYNTLSAIRGLCGKDPVRARDAIGDFSVFLRANMDSLTNDRPISFEQELRHVKSYLNLEVQMNGDKLRVEYDIRSTGFLMPALSLQPIAENAVQKGILKKEGGGTVLIRTEETDECFQITVEDDGVGFDPESIDENGHIGLKNVDKRLRSLCGGRLDIRSRPEEGSTVTISIPKEGTAV